MFVRIVFMYVYMLLMRIFRTVRSHEVVLDATQRLSNLFVSSKSNKNNCDIMVPYSVVRITLGSVTKIRNNSLRKQKYHMSTAEIKRINAFFHSANSNNIILLIPYIRILYLGVIF